MPITVAKTVHIPSEWLGEVAEPHPEGYSGIHVVECNTIYRDGAGLRLTQIYGGTIASDVWGKYFQRFSDDNGRTWSDPIVVYRPQQAESGTVRWNEGCLFLDEEKNRLFHFVNYSIFPKNRITIEVLRTTRILERVSTDGGRTFTGKQLIQRGYDETNWADGVSFGRNRICVSFPAPLKLKNGNILLPVARSPVANENDSPFLIHNNAGCMIGKWKADRIEWDLSEMVTVNSSTSSRGLCEPALAEMNDGSILMIMRGSNYGLNGAPGYKWQSISRDGGYTWSKPVPWTYQTREPFYSPGSGSRLIHNAGNGRLYWIGNITPANPTGGIPRCPLQIAEVDEESKNIVKESMTIIDDRQAGDGPETQLSNFRVYEDRVTHEFVLNLARIGERGGKDRASPSYQYRISIDLNMKPTNLP